LNYRAGITGKNISFFRLIKPLPPNRIPQNPLQISILINGISFILSSSQISLI
jgi:hypothetical protein